MTPKTLVAGIKYFTKYVKSVKPQTHSASEATFSGFTKIVRIKNLFIEKGFDIAKPKYCDIKINVVFQYLKFSMVCEVQFLLKELLDSKKRNHEFYDLKRRKEIYDFVRENLVVLSAKVRFFGSIQNSGYASMKSIRRMILNYGYNANTMTDDGMKNSALFLAVKAG